MSIQKRCKEIEEYVINLRRYFHQHPEVSLQEKETSGVIRKELEKLGIPYEELLPSYGIVATIQGNYPGKTIALRADIDALPMQEETPVEYRSLNDGVMHACGHDAHAAMLLGAACILNEQKEQLHGTVKLVFQAAEEIGLGISEVLDYFESIGGVDQVIGLHIWSLIPEGKILLRPESVFSGGNGFEIALKGQGGHGARPDLCQEPIKAACDLVLKISSIPSNFYNVMDYSVVSVGRIESGTLSNIFPDTATICGTTRYFSPGGGEKLKELIKRMGRGIAEAYDLNVDVSFNGGVPPVYNNPAAIERARVLAEDIEGLSVSEQTEPVCAGDNFGYMLEKYPGFYGILGCGNEEKGCCRAHHNTRFNLDETALRKGYEFMARYALDFLK